MTIPMLLTPILTEVHDAAPASAVLAILIAPIVVSVLLLDLVTTRWTGSRTPRTKEDQARR
jgi:hypothetical protein